MRYVGGLSRCHSPSYTYISTYCIFLCVGWIRWRGLDGGGANPGVPVQAIWAIYVWCRRTDDIVDGPRAMVRGRKSLQNDLADVRRLSSSGVGGNLGRVRRGRVCAAVEDVGF